MGAFRNLGHLVSVMLVLGCGASERSASDGSGAAGGAGGGQTSSAGGSATSTGGTTSEPEPSERELLEAELQRAATAEVYARCERYLRCCDAGYLDVVEWDSVGACVSDILAAQTRVLVERADSVDAGFAAVDTQAIDACAEQRDEPAESCERPAACSFVNLVRPLSMQGDGCYQHPDCVGSAYCSPESLTCMPRVEEGEACSQDYECATSRCLSGGSCGAAAIDGSGCDD